MLIRLSLISKIFLDHIVLELYCVSLYRHEFRHNHGEWIDSVKPVLESATSTQICGPLEASDEEIEICKSIRNELQAAVSSLLKVAILIINLLLVNILRF